MTTQLKNQFGKRRRTVASPARVSTFAFFLFLAVTSFRTTAQTSECVGEVERLQKSFREEDALQAVLRCLSRDPLDYNAVCKAAFLYAKCGNRLDDAEKKKSHFNLSKRYAAVALKRKPDDAEAHYVMAVALGRLALISGPSDKVGASREIKEHIDAALKANPSHAGAWYLLGRWNFEVANLNFAEVAVAKYLFGGLPDGASLDNALVAYEKAVELAPNRILHRYDLALAYHDAGNDTLAKTEIETLLKMKQTDQDDAQTFAEAKALLTKLKQ